MPKTKTKKTDSHQLIEDQIMSQRTNFVYNSDLFENDLSPIPPSDMLINEIALVKLQINELSDQQLKFNKLLEQVVEDNKASNITIFRNKISENFYKINNQFDEHDKSLKQNKQYIQDYVKTHQNQIYDIQQDIVQLAQEVIKTQQNQRSLNSKFCKQNSKIQTDQKVMKRMLKNTNIYDYYIQHGIQQKTQNKSDINMKQLEKKFADIQQDIQHQISSFDDMFTKHRGQIKTQIDMQLQKVNETIQKQDEAQMIKNKQLMSTFESFRDVMKEDSEMLKLNFVSLNQNFIDNRTDLNDQIMQSEKKFGELDSNLKKNADQLDIHTRQLQQMHDNYESMYEKQTQFDNEFHTVQLQLQRMKEDQIDQKMLQQQRILLDELQIDSERFKREQIADQERVRQFTNQFSVLNQNFLTQNESLSAFQQYMNKLKLDIYAELEQKQNQIELIRRNYSIQQINDLIDTKINGNIQVITSQNELNELKFLTSQFQHDLSVLQQTGVSIMHPEQKKAKTRDVSLISDSSSHITNTFTSHSKNTQNRANVLLSKRVRYMKQGVDDIAHNVQGFEEKLDMLSRALQQRIVIFEQKMKQTLKENQCQQIKVLTEQKDIAARVQVTFEKLTDEKVEIHTHKSFIDGIIEKQTYIDKRMEEVQEKMLEKQQITEEITNQQKSTIKKIQDIQKLLQLTEKRLNDYAQLQFQHEETMQLVKMDHKTVMGTVNELKIVNSSNETRFNEAFDQLNNVKRKIELTNMNLVKYQQQLAILQNQLERISLKEQAKIGDALLDNATLNLSELD
ncbi:Conserved_hypothetical protein [Hexamita inflata]|uniref:Uncharacterized protein n=1 Tax=Hexamita inflata TaxID=28002 RepID=A0AA86R3D3_9EUKA|nr:Conserved hypothetical protein [Hexamita inflata]